MVRERVEMVEMRTTEVGSHFDVVPADPEQWSKDGRAFFGKVLGSY